MPSAILLYNVVATVHMDSAAQLCYKNCKQTSRSKNNFKLKQGSKNKKAGKQGSSYEVTYTIPADMLVEIPNSIMVIWDSMSTSIHPVPAGISDLSCFITF